MSAEFSANAPIVSVRNLTKFYGREAASRNVSIDFHLGRIHAVIGENGAGKSTLMKMLFGLEQPSEGEIVFRGQPVAVTSPRVAKGLRIAMVHQHFMLAENLSVEDHLRLEVNSRDKTWGVGPYSSFEKKIAELQSFLKLDVPLNSAVRQLSIVQKQKLEILKTLLFDPDFLIFDEPTAVLPPNEVEKFYGLLRELRSKPTAIAIVTHKLREVMMYADDVTVLRRGEVKFHSAVSSTSAEILARNMVGENITKTVNDFHIRTKGRETILSFKDFSFHHPTLRLSLVNVDARITAGEIVAFAGVEGNGQTDLIKCILFPELCDGPRAQGSIQLFGTPLVESGHSLVRHAGVRRLPIGWIGEDRLRESAIAEFNLSDHFRLLPHHRSKARLAPVALELLTQAQSQFDIRPLRLNLKLGDFSGGNQQKWVIAREVSHSPRLLIAAHPTRGVDFAAEARIHATFRELRGQNKSVIFISSDLDEICNLADRILVFFKGQIISEFTPPFSRERLGQAFGGHV